MFYGFRFTKRDILEIHMQNVGIGNICMASHAGNTFLFCMYGNINIDTYNIYI